MKTLEYFSQKIRDQDRLVTSSGHEVRSLARSVNYLESLERRIESRITKTWLGNHSRKSRLAETRRNLSSKREKLRTAQEKHNFASGELDGLLEGYLASTDPETYMTIDRAVSISEEIVRRLEDNQKYMETLVDVSADDEHLWSKVRSTEREFYSRIGVFYLDVAESVAKTLPALVEELSELVKREEAELLRVFGVDEQARVVSGDVGIFATYIDELDGGTEDLSVQRTGELYERMLNWSRQLGIDAWQAKRQLHGRALREIEKAKPQA